MLLAISGCSAPPPAEHLIVLCLDTVRADHLSTYGYSSATAPTLDALARRGILYRDAASPSNWTVPAVASLFTSLDPEEHGAFVPGDVRQLSADSPPGQMHAELETLAERLARAGFATGLFSGNPFLYGSFKDGFDTVAVERTDAASLVDLSLEWWRAAEEKRRFLYLQFMDAHEPSRPPDAYFQLFRVPSGLPREERHAGWAHGRQTQFDAADFKEFRAQRIAAYDGAIRYIDAEIARLLAGIEHATPGARPLLIVTSDHGEEFWDHAEQQATWRDDPRGLWGIGHGHTLFEELLHVPLIVVGPGYPEGIELDCPVSLLDLYPTALASLGLPLPPGLRGLPLPTRGGATCSPRSLAASQPAYGPISRSLRYREWKLIEREGLPTQLFDLARDPGEHVDLAATQPAVVDTLSRELERRLGSAAAPGATPEISEETLRELRALGYL